MVYHDEPELRTSGLSGEQFKNAFEDQAKKIRMYAKEKGLTNVKVAMDAATIRLHPPWRLPRPEVQGEVGTATEWRKIEAGKVAS